MRRMRKGKFGAERQAVHERGERKADQGGGEGAAENDDEGMFADEHVQVAAHQDHEADDADARHQAKTCRNIHDLPHPTLTRLQDKTPAPPCR